MYTVTHSGHICNCFKECSNHLHEPLRVITHRHTIHRQLLRAEIDKVYYLSGADDHATRVITEGLKLLFGVTLRQAPERFLIAANRTNKNNII